MSGQFFVREIRKLGTGGLGTVDEVEITHSTCHLPVGLRLARKRLNAKWARDGGVQQRFIREMEMLAAMQHSNIVSLVGTYVAGAEPAYYMPLYGGSLRSAIQAGRRFRQLDGIKAFCLAIASALVHAHSHNFIHRDLKPENILLDAQDNPVVADWGLGQFIHQHSMVLDLTVAGPMGTAHYASLEQWAMGRCDVTGDVYSLGMIAGELAAHAPVAIAHIGAGIQHDVLPATHPQFVRFNQVLKAMAHPNPAHRYKTMQHVIAALNGV